MSIQLNKEEKKIYAQVIRKWYKIEGEELSISRILFELHTQHGLRRHSVPEQGRLAKAMLKKYRASKG